MIERRFARLACWIGFAGAFVACSGGSSTTSTASNGDDAGSDHFDGGVPPDSGGASDATTTCAADASKADHDAVCAQAKQGAACACDTSCESFLCYRCHTGPDVYELALESGCICTNGAWDCAAPAGAPQDCTPTTPNTFLDDKCTVPNGGADAGDGG